MSQYDDLEKLDLLWGAHKIGAALGIDKYKTFHLLATGKLPAKKCGKQWVASREELRQFFSNSNSAAA